MINESQKYYVQIFASLVHATVRYLDLTTFGWSLKLVSAISKYFPLLEVIILQKVTVASGGVAIDNLYDSLRNALPAFQHLRTINLAHIHRGPNPISLSDLDKEFEVVSGWGDVCPSVGSCTLLSGVTWCRIPGAWFPKMQDANRFLLIEWLAVIMASGKYPDLTEHIVEVIEDDVMPPTNIQLLAQSLKLKLRSAQAVAETGSESDVGRDSDSDGEERSENDIDLDDADADEDSDGEEGDQDDADQDSDYTPDESKGDSDVEEEVSADEDQL
ncbi:hypothetical protein FIBSPDRAFT_966359 [Athelia psychrophila]|nr:hypothetical protein FIBSPDRAFT_966359 [Fibularhizoctonia sp. CBS 109695]